MQEMHPHTARHVRNVPRGAGALDDDATKGGEIPIMDGGVRVLVLLERGSHAGEVGLIRRGLRSGSLWGEGVQEAQGPEHRCPWGSLIGASAPDRVHGASERER